MKIKPFSLICLALGLILTLVALILPFISLQAANSNSDVGIIGGSDTPTYCLFLFKASRGIYITLLSWGTSLLVSALLAFLLQKALTKHCTLKTSAISLVISADLALGMLCAIVLLSVSAFNESSKHPIAFPASLSTGAICLFGLFGSIAAYFYTRAKDRSPIGVLIDIFTAAIYFPPFFLTSFFIYDLLSR